MWWHTLSLHWVQVKKKMLLMLIMHSPSLQCLFLSWVKDTIWNSFCPLIPLSGIRTGSLSESGSSEVSSMTFLSIGTSGLFMKDLHPGFRKAALCQGPLWNVPQKWINLIKRDPFPLCLDFCIQLEISSRLIYLFEQLKPNVLIFCLSLLNVLIKRVRK